MQLLAINQTRHLEFSMETNGLLHHSKVQRRRGGLSGKVREDSLDMRGLMWLKEFS